jgi:hypothetical protein
MNKTYQIINLDLSLLNDLTDTHTNDVSLPLSGLLYNDLHDHYSGGAGSFLGKLASGVAKITQGAVVQAAQGAVEKAAEGVVASGKNTIDRGRNKAREMAGQIRDTSRSLSPRVQEMVKTGIQSGKNKIKGMVQNVAGKSDQDYDENPDSDQEASPNEQPQQRTARSHNKSTPHKLRKMAVDLSNSATSSNGEIEIHTKQSRIIEDIKHSLDNLSLIQLQSLLTIINELNKLKI